MGCTESGRRLWVSISKSSIVFRGFDTAVSPMTTYGDLMCIIRYSAYCTCISALGELCLSTRALDRRYSKCLQRKLFYYWDVSMKTAVLQLSQTMRRMFSGESGSYECEIRTLLTGSQIVDLVARKLKPDMISKAYFKAGRQGISPR